MGNESIDRTTAPGFAPKVDRHGRQLRPGDEVRWCIPASKWNDVVGIGKIVVNPVIPTRVGGEWIATLSLETPEGQIWVLPGEAIELI